MVVDMTVGGDGTVTAGDIYRARVLNHAKLAYNSVAAWLDGTAPPPARLAAVAGLDQQLRLQDRVAQAMRSERRANGALRLESIEARPVFQTAHWSTCAGPTRAGPDRGFHDCRQRVGARS